MLGNGSHIRQMPHGGLLRVALDETKDTVVAAIKTVCLEIAEDQAERCRRVGAEVAQQTALTIAARIRRRHV